MKRILLLTTMPIVFLFTGCIDIIEEVFLNADGSGKYVITTDMSALVSEEMEELLSSGEEKNAEEEPPIELDTTIRLADLNPEAYSRLDRPEVFKNSFLHLLISDSQKKMIMTYSFNFNKVDDINYFRQHLSEFASEDMGTLEQGVLPEISGKLFSLQGKTLTRYKVEDCDSENLTDENKEMMAMMFEGGLYTTIYHFPGKVKKTTLANANISGNTLSVEYEMMDILNCEAQTAGTVKFKKR